jgi:hypothetical protein
VRALFAKAVVLVAASVVGCGGCSSKQTPAPAPVPKGVLAPVGKPRPVERTHFDDHVTLKLQRNAPGGVVSFGLPLPPRAVSDPKTVRVEIGGKTVAARVDELLAEHDATGARTGARAIRIQLPEGSVQSDLVEVTVRWKGGEGATTPARRSYRDDVAFESPETVKTVERTIRGGRFVEGPAETRTLFVGREPRVLARYPEGYLAETRILGGQVTAREAARPDRAGLSFLSDALRAFTGSALFDETYALNPDPNSVPDPKTSYEGWLYDRCATLLLALAHNGEVRFGRSAMRHCSYYADHVRLEGEGAGIFTGKPEPDPKYSHLRGLYVYYALTGDEAALAAGKAIARMWLDEPLFVKPYRAGHMRGKDKQWTERLLGTSLEGLYYGHRLTGSVEYLDAFRELFDTAYQHVTGDAATLARINPGVGLPPQNCFIHTAEQHGEGNATEPWCSGWMTELLVDPLLRYQDQTGDPRVDEVFVRLARFIRDVGSGYFRGNPLGDSFLHPSICDDRNDVENRRMLIPAYGAGIGADGKRKYSGEYEDYLHCADATALTAVALRALVRTGQYDKNPVPPFASEGESFKQLHHDLSFCARQAFQNETRTRRDPAQWTAGELARGAANPTKFILDNKIGFPSHAVSPARRLSWWFNTSLEQYSILSEAGVEVGQLTPGRVNPPNCR